MFPHIVTVHETTELSSVTLWAGRGGGGGFGRGKVAGDYLVISPGGNYATLETPEAQSAIFPNDCSKTHNICTRDSKIATHCDNVVTELLPKSHQERHLKAEVRVTAVGL